MFEITEKVILNDTMTKISVKAPLVAKKVQPGQFVILKVNETGERIPLTISDFNVDNGTVSVIYQKVGKTTMLLDTLNQGDFIQNFVGPLGKPSEIEGYKNVAVIGGGAGCAIAYPQAKALCKMGANVDMIAGFRNVDLIILKDEMSKACTNFMLMTDDGSNGNKGFVTNALEKRINEGAGFDLVIAIGPVPMMKAVCNLTKKYNIKTLVSMNPIMIDGTGMCGCCRVKVNGQTKFACVDGPDFDGHEIDFDDLMKRLRTYSDKEQTARDEFCNLLKKGENVNG